MHSRAGLSRPLSHRRIRVEPVRPVAQLQPNPQTSWLHRAVPADQRRQRADRAAEGKIA
jgi:hypothetical protein